jgi:predicted PurR-regulated permease PerM
MASERGARERWTVTGIRVWTVIGILLLVYAAFWFMSAISFALLPITIGLMVVLLLYSPVEFLAKYMSRPLAVIVCYLAVVVVLAVGLLFIIPPMYAQIVQFVQDAPGLVNKAFEWWRVNIVLPQTKSTGFDLWLQTAVIALKDQLLAGSGTWSTSIAQYALSAGGFLSIASFHISIALMLAFYALADLPRLEHELFVMTGEHSRDEVTHALRTTTRAVGGWLSGTLIQSVLVAALMAAGLAVLGVPYAVPIGVLGGLLNPVPFIGPGLSWIIAAVAGWFVSPWLALWAFLMAAGVSNLNGLVLAPRIMSDRVDVHPLVVIIALLVGTSLFGVPGVIFSVPVAAVINGLFVYWYEKRTERQVASEDGVIFRASKEESESEAVAHASEQAREDAMHGGPGGVAGLDI